MRLHPAGIVIPQCAPHDSIRENIQQGFALAREARRRGYSYLYGYYVTRFNSSDIISEHRTIGGLATPPTLFILELLVLIDVPTSSSPDILPNTLGSNNGCSRHPSHRGCRPHRARERVWPAEAPECWYISHGGLFPETSESYADFFLRVQLIIHS